MSAEALAEGAVRAAQHPVVAHAQLQQRAPGVHRPIRHAHRVRPSLASNGPWWPGHRRATAAQLPSRCALCRSIYWRLGKQRCATPAWLRCTRLPGRCLWTLTARLLCRTTEQGIQNVTGALGRHRERLHLPLLWL